MKLLRRKSPAKQPGEGRHRLLFWTSFQHDAYNHQGSHAQPEYNEDVANLVGSLTNDGLHMPVIDIDFECELIPSSTAGHYHLYFDKPIEWEKYQKLLTVLWEIGYIDDGWYRQSMIEFKTVVRKPGVYKTTEAAVAAMRRKLEQGGRMFDKSIDVAGPNGY